MQNDHAEHLAKAGKEALELIKEFNETDRLMREQRWDELIAHVQQIVLKYPLDTAAYNLVHPYLLWSRLGRTARRSYAGSSPAQ